MNTPPPDIRSFSISPLSSPTDPLIPQVIALHRSTFPSGLLSRLGEELITSYYSRMIDSSACRVLVCVDENQSRLLGFISFTTDNTSPSLAKVMSKAKKLALRELLSLQLSPLIALRALIKSIKGRPVHGMPELLSIAVDPACRL